MILNLFILTVIICFIVDISGIIEQLKRWLFKIAYPEKPYRPYSLKPFDCSLCMTWWAGLVYITIYGCFDLPHIALVVLMAYLSERVKNAMELVSDFFGTTIDKLKNFINK